LLQTSLFDRYESLDSKLKAAFTRQYNAGEHRSQALVEEMMVSKKRRGGGGEDEEDDGEGTTEDLEAAREVRDNEGSDDDVDLEAFMKKHSAKKGKASAGKASAGKGKKK
jgi:hypothetical protein